MASILVVDDRADVVSMTRLVLAAYGHDTYGATSGIEALEVAKSTPVEAAIVDVAMPDMNGLELADELRRLRGGSLVLIALTGWTSTTMRRAVLEAGFDYFAMKPTDGRHLSQLIEHALRKAG